MKVEEIAEAVAKLPPDQLARFRRWFIAFEAGRANYTKELEYRPHRTRDSVSPFPLSRRRKSISRSNAGMRSCKLPTTGRTDAQM